MTNVRRSQSYPVWCRFSTNSNCLLKYIQYNFPFYFYWVQESRVYEPYGGGVIIYDLSPISDTRFQFYTYSFTSHYFRACLNWRFAAQSSNLTPPLSSDSLHPHPAGTPRRTLPRASRVPLPTIRWTERCCCCCQRFAAY